MHANRQDKKQVCYTRTTDDEDRSEHMRKAPSLASLAKSLTNNKCNSNTAFRCIWLS